MRLKMLFQSFWFILGLGTGLTMSPSNSSIQASSFTTSSSTTSSISPTSLPTPPHSMCRTGPQFDNFLPDVADNINAYSLAVTDHVYLDNSDPVPCSGVITRWHYCFVVLGFHNLSSGLQPCVWRRSNPKDNSSAGYVKVGCNEFAIIPGERDGLQCQYFAPLSHSDFIRVEEGDYIGFYVPDAGLFVPFSLPSDDDDDAGSYQQQRIAMGFAPFIKDSELRNATTQPGRALLSAEIGTAPSATVSQTSSSALVIPTTPVPINSSSISQSIDSPTTQPMLTTLKGSTTTSVEPETTTATPAGTVSTVLLIVGVVVPSTIAFTVVLVTISIVCVYCKKYVKYKRFHSDTAEFLPKLLENPAYNMVSQNQVMIGNQLTLIDCTSNQAYNHGMVGKLETVVQVKNQAYNVLSANHVIIGKKRTTVNLSDNPAYDLTTSGMGQPKSKSQRPDSIASSAGKKQLEHTYESLSLSPYYAHPYHRLS